MKNKKKWYKSVSNWIVIVACIILIPILLINLSIMFQAQTNKDAVPSVFGYKPFIVLSGSMESEIFRGDLVITKIIEPEDLKKDDVIAFRDAENTVTTHRIIDIVENNGTKYFITKGDNNNSQDKNLVEYSDVEGLYITRIPGIGSMMNSLSQPTTILIVAMGITVIFVIGFSISTKKQRELERLEFLEYKKMKEEMNKEGSKTKKAKSIKAQEEDSLEEIEEESKPKKKSSTAATKKEPVKKTTSKAATDKAPAKKSTSKTVAKKEPVKKTTSTTKKSTSKSTTGSKTSTAKKTSTTSKSASTSKTTTKKKAN